MQLLLPKCGVNKTPNKAIDLTAIPLRFIANGEFGRLIEWCRNLYQTKKYINGNSLELTYPKVADPKACWRGTHPRNSRQKQICLPREIAKRYLTGVFRRLLFTCLRHRYLCAYKAPFARFFVDFCLKFGTIPTLYSRSTGKPPAGPDS